MRALGLMILIVLLIESCGQENCREVAPLKTSVDLEIVRTEQELFDSESVNDVISYLEKYPQLAYYFWHNHQYPSDTILAGRIFSQIKHPSVDTVYQESVQAFEKMNEVEEELEEAFGRLKQLYPNAKTPEVYSAVSVFYNDLFISDSLIVLGLDHFIGDNATYDPQDIAAYILKRYDRAHLPSIVMQFICGHYVRAGNKQTLLSDMIDFGKTYYLNSRLLPCTPDSILIGYSPQQMADIRSNREVIWANFIENQLLYDTDHFIKKKFLSERPNVYEIGEKCPGRIGAWIGWEIVESYMANNDVTIIELMDDTDHHKIFELSGYKPRDE
ncbi:MAG: gliding motility lipoprotein GldB [Cytophagales bacterium]|nr:gliding motility lipoprotein GldB [Cytophagales bacterium]